MEHRRRSKNVLQERYTFFQRCQLANENFYQFLEDVQHLASSCRFYDLEESLVRDRIVFGVNNTEIREQLLNDGGDPSLDDIIQICTEIKCADTEREDIPSTLYPVEQLILKTEEFVSVDFLEEMDEIDEMGEMDENDDETKSEENFTTENKGNVCYHCRICDNKYLLSNSLCRHMYDTHVNLPELRCLNCDKRFAYTADLRRHIARYRDTIELTSHEMYSFVNQREIKRNSKETRFLCKICKMEYSHATSFSRHIYTMHADVANIKCLNCVEQFSTKHELKTHMVQHREIVQNKTELLPFTINSDSECNEWNRSKIESITSSTMNFLCTICLNTYNHATSFSRHLYDIHADLDNLMCLNCDRRFDSLKNLRTHMIGYRKTMESDANNQIDKLELVATNTENILRTEENPGTDGNLSSSYKCPICEDICDNLSHLTAHLYKCHADFKQLRCLYCHLKFKTSNQLKYHMIRHRKKSINCRSFYQNAENTAAPSVSRETFVEPPNDYDQTQSNIERNTYICTICQRSYFIKQSCSRHILSTHTRIKELSLQCNNCLKIFQTQYALKEHTDAYIVTIEKPKIATSVENVNHPHSMYCEQCNKTFVQRNHYEQHMKKHLRRTEDPKQFTCEICGKSFQKNYMLKYHMDNHMAIQLAQSNEPNKLQYQCYRCKRFSLTLNSLQRHMRRHEKNALCFICGMAFNKMYVLEAHLKTHSNEMSFQCNVCHQSFKSKIGLDNHLTQHTGVRPFKCNICERSFGVHHHLKTHLNRTHGDRKFECTICQKKYRHKQQLKRHRFVHTGEYPYKCRFCSKEFRNNFNCKVHMRKHHNHYGVQLLS